MEGLCETTFKMLSFWATTIYIFQKLSLLLVNSGSRTVPIHRNSAQNPAAAEKINAGTVAQTLINPPSAPTGLPKQDTTSTTTVEL